MKRWRHFVVVLGLVPSLMLYAFACIWLGEFVTGINEAVDLLFYGVAGLIWLWPAAFVVSWLARHEAK